LARDSYTNYHEGRIAPVVWAPRKFWTCCGIKVVMTVVRHFRPVRVTVNEAAPPRVLARIHASPKVISFSKPIGTGSSRLAGPAAQGGPRLTLLSVAMSLAATIARRPKTKLAGSPRIEAMVTAFLSQEHFQKIISPTFTSHTYRQ
jgi:hypothetical protein